MHTLAKKVIIELFYIYCYILNIYVVAKAFLKIREIMSSMTSFIHHFLNSTLNQKILWIEEFGVTRDF